MWIISDDLTGSAEMGGVAWRYGLSARVAMRRPAAPGCDVSVVDTETRPLSAELAAESLQKVLAGVTAPVFKKTDSVLRGPVRAEIEAAMQALGKRRCILVPCNPSLGRFLKRGVYLVGDQELHQTGFRSDPSHPALTSKAVELLARTKGTLPLHVADLGDALPAEGIILGNAESVADVRRWAKRLDAATLPAGAADFYSAILETRGLPVRTSPAEPAGQGRMLVVSGSATERSRAGLQAFEQGGGIVLRMPEALFHGSGDINQLIEEWARAAASALREQPRVAIAIARPPAGPTTVNLLVVLCETASEIIASAKPEAIWVEGGSTAASLATRLGWAEFDVFGELIPGVVELRPAAAPQIGFVLKPGSYRWPEA